MKLLGILGASVLGNPLIGKKVITAGKGANSENQYF